MKRGGGVAIFLKIATAYKKPTDLELMGDSYESVFIEIDKYVFYKEKNVIIGDIYRPLGTD